MIGFLIDENLPPRLEGLLRRAGHQAFHVSSLHLTGRPDHEVAEAAIAQTLVILTKDKDFDQQGQSLSGPHVVRLNIGKKRPAEIEAILQSRLPEIVERLNIGERLIVIESNLI